MDIDEPPAFRFRITNVTLPAYAAGEQEIVPVLQDDHSGLPLRLALRWTMRGRRLAVGEKTLTDDQRASALLYAFCKDQLKLDLDDHFAEGGKLTSGQLDKLIDYLREGKGGGRGIRALTTTGQLVANIERFLKWLAHPAGRGGSGFVVPAELAIYYAQLQGAFADLRVFRSRGKRIPPLKAEQDVELEQWIGPIRATDGKYRLPLRFKDTNPWDPSTRLRNWIGYRLARELGIRRGEVGKIRIDDVQNTCGDANVAVKRRPHDPADTRKSANRPRVKTVERELPISRVLLYGIQQYMHTLLIEGGRRGAATPYLLVTAEGRPISGSSLDAIWKAVNAKWSGVHLSWHVLRHTWAEETAEGLLSGAEGALDSDDVAMGILRELGGWAPTSSTPYHYIQNAMKKRGDEYLRKRNARFDGRFT